ncbi:MAG: hypothetical protein ABGY95_01340 [Rubritalea sp.]|uniref:hypothetical protein n=1 Tax=Rubritalea sp. TaxID=2109375 RepID=UPI003241D460
MKDFILHVFMTKTVLYSLLKYLLSVVGSALIYIVGAYLTNKGLWLELYDFAMTPDRLGVIFSMAFIVFLSLLKTFSSSYEEFKDN